jgi:hypothetical protein
VHGGVHDFLFGRFVDAHLFGVVISSYLPEIMALRARSANE